MGEATRTEPGWPAVVFLFAVALFGSVLVGRAPTWPIYVTILAWWGFVIFRIFQSPPAGKPNQQDRAWSNSSIK
jgi:hypothetical protein